MRVMNSMVIDAFDRIVSEAAKLARCNGKVTIAHREIRSAVRLIFPGALSLHATAEGNNALVNTRMHVRTTTQQ
jgi:histone H2B